MGPRQLLFYPDELAHQLSGWGSPDRICGENRFGSSHSSGLNVAMADGSTRFVTFSVSQAAFQAIGTCNGGEVADLP